MSKGRNTTTMILAAGALYLTFTHHAVNACELIETKWGGYVGVDCTLEAFGPQAFVKQPNLRPRSLSENVIGNAVDLTIGVKNHGQAGTEGLLSLAGGSTGEFDTTIDISVLDMNGNSVMFWDEYTGQFQSQLQATARFPRLAAGAQVRRYIHTIYLPDRDQNYDVCVTAMADSKIAGNPGGEVWESAENDNVRRFQERIYPSAQSGVDPDYSTPSYCPQ